MQQRQTLSSAQFAKIVSANGGRANTAVQKRPHKKQGTQKPPHSVSKR
jgi:hypothetical protein